MDCSGFEAGECAKLLLASLQGRECFARAGGKHAPGLGETAAATVSLDQTLPRCRLEETHVLACGRLPDPNPPRSCRDGPLLLDLDEQPQAGGVPEKRKRCIGHDDDPYRKIRLAPYYGDVIG
jgi:hypothetical protein